MEVLIEQTVKNYEVVINQTARTIDVTIVTEPKTFETIIEPFGPRGFKGDTGGTYVDVELLVTVDGQTEFNIFTEPMLSNLYINDSIFFKDKSYQIQNILGNWKLIWLGEFQLTTTDLLIFRKIEQ